MKLNDKGLLIVISGPSGVGKGTIRQALFEIEDHNLDYSVSMTTRNIREGEVDGEHYHFVDRDTFKQRIEDGLFLEYAEFVGNYYGTPIDKIQEKLDLGREVVLEIEIEGARQVRDKVDDAIFIFIGPPSKQALYNRLNKRGTESQEIIEQRVAKADAEFDMAYMYDYIVINDSVENAADKILAIIRAEHTRTRRTFTNYKKILEE